MTSFKDFFMSVLYLQFNFGKTTQARDVRIPFPKITSGQKTQDFLTFWTDLQNKNKNEKQIDHTLDDLEKMRVRGKGGAPTRATSLPIEAVSRKNFPIATGVLDYFPDALVAISEISKAGNDQHNPGLPLHWERSKSGDESDTCMRHFLQRGTLDTDGKRHTAKAAWRILALLQKEIEQEQDNELTNQQDPDNIEHS